MQERINRPRKAVNLSVDAELLAEAKAAGTNLSSVLEQALKEKLRSQRRQQWLDANRAAIESGNAELERNGAWYTPDWLGK